MVVFLAPLAGAQLTTSYELFDDQADEPWFTSTGQTTVGGKLNVTAGNVVFTLADPHPVSIFTYTVHCPFRKTGGGSQSDSIAVSGDAGDLVSVAQRVATTSTLNCEIRISYDVPNLVLSVIVPRNPGDLWVQQPATVIVFYMDWVNDEFNVTINGVTAGTDLDFKTNLNSEMTGWTIGRGTTLAVHYDELAVDGTIADLPPEITEPGEFDSGLIAFITGLGFVTPASQFFFSIILVGIATVSGGVALKFMAPGRMKVVLVASIAVLVGTFCTVLQLFDLWIFVLAAVLAGTIIKGAGEVRNTWREIRETAANRSRTLNQDGEVVQETTQTAPEPATTATAAESAD